MAMWLEILSLRAAGKSARDAALALLRNVEAPPDAAGPASCRLYQNAKLEYDLSLHLYWGAECGAAAKSPLGLRLAEALAAYGLVNHTLWITERSQG